MTRFPTAGHLVSWAKRRRAPSSPAPGAAPARPGRVTPTSRASWARPPPQRPRPTPSSASGTAAGEADRQAQGPRCRSPLDPGDHLAPAVRPRRPLHRPGPPATHASRIDTGRKARSHIRQLEALGFTVTTRPGSLTRAPPHRRARAGSAGAAARPAKVMFSGQQAIMSRPVSSRPPRSAVRQPGADVFQPNRLVGVRGRGHHGQAAAAQHAARRGPPRADHADRATADHPVRGEAGTDEEEPAACGRGPSHQPAETEMER